LRLSQNLIDAGVASGYYFISVFLRNGSAGLQQDPEMSLRYLRKAADTGGAQAQYEVGDKLAPIDVAPDVARQMRRCAAEQGHGEAAVELAVNLQGRTMYQEAVRAFQLGVAGGYSSSASFLHNGFRGPTPDNSLYYLAQPEDIERAERYEKIWRVLANYSYANPKVPEINEIVPLPPAALPEWDGKLQWLEARLANVPPEKPSEALIHELAKAKVLDPVTGKPLPGSPGFSKTNFIGVYARSDEPCPQSGYWRVTTRPWEGRVLMDRNDPRYFKEGDILPKAPYSFYRPRIWPLGDKYVEYQYRVQWGMVG
jgi:hypothetical protein